MGIVKADNISYQYIRRDEDDNIEDINVALDGVSLDVKQGQFICVLGHNGSGKSTFAKHINALLTPSDGTLFVDGIDTSKEESVMDVRQRAGMVFQNPDNQIIASIVEEDVGFLYIALHDRNGNVLFLQDGASVRRGLGKQIIEFDLKLDSNPELTGSVMIAFARAAYRLNREGRSGCMSIFDIAPKYLIDATDDDIRKELL